MIGRDGRIAAGWVGSGCAEGTVCHAALDSLDSGETIIIDLDLNDEVLDIGTPCRGTMRVFVEPLQPSPTTLGGSFRANKNNNNARPRCLI